MIEYINFVLRNQETYLADSPKRNLELGSKSYSANVYSLKNTNSMMMIGSNLEET